MARPRQYDPETLRAAVVSAARGLLEEGGPPALTARALAQASGATSGTIYASFGDLHRVLIEVNRDTFRELGEMIDTLPDAPPEPWRQTKGQKKGRALSSAVVQQGGMKCGACRVSMRVI